MNIEKIVRPNILAMTAYSSARDEFQGSEGLFLDANESPFQNEINRYPDPYQKELKTSLAKRNNVKENNIFIGNGSDETLDLLVRAFCQPQKDELIICPPTYGMYKVIAAINDVKVVEVPLDNTFNLATNAILNSITTNTKIIFICSPNNPTGNDLAREAVLVIASRFDGIVVVDEAYIDFSNQDSFIKEIRNHNNIFVTQTFSKSFGAAGLRLGMGFGNPFIIEVLNTIKPPYNVNILSQQRGVEILNNEEQLLENVSTILTEKERLFSALNELDLIVEIFPSAANFWLVRFKNANLIWKALCQFKIVVRNRSNQMNCENTLRITVGTHEENNLLIEKLKEIEIKTT